MDHDKHPDCLIQFAEIKQTHARIESDINRLMGAFFGNGKDGFEKSFIRFQGRLDRDVEELKLSLKEQDTLIQKMIDDRQKSEESQKTEKIKGYFALGTAVLIALMNGLVVLGIWRWTGQIP